MYFSICCVYDLPVFAGEHPFFLCFLQRSEFTCVCHWFYKLLPATNPPSLPLGVFVAKFGSVFHGERVVSMDTSVSKQPTSFWPPSNLHAFQYSVLKILCNFFEMRFNLAFSLNFINVG